MQTCKVGTPADVWSLCCVAYEMLYGDTPFEFLVKRIYSWYSIPRSMVEHLILALIIDHKQEYAVLLILNALS